MDLDQYAGGKASLVSFACDVYDSSVRVNKAVLSMYLLLSKVKFDLASLTTLNFSSGKQIFALS